MLRTIIWLAFTALLLPGRIASASEQDRIAILDLTNHAQLASQEADYITDIVRAAARQAFAGGQFIIMTRDNVLELLPADATLADCLGECAVQTGRRLGARFVVAGEVLVYSSELRVSLQLYSTVDGNLIASERIGASDLLGLEAPLASTARKLFGPIGASWGGSRFQDMKIGGDQVPWSPDTVAEVVVSFISEPEGATVEIGQIPECITPCARPLAPGEYLIAMKYPRYLPESRLVVVKAGIEPIAMALEPNFGWLTISSIPPGLPANVDGDVVGITPVSDYEIKPGSHEVLIEDDRYQETGMLTHIARGERKRIELSPVPRLGGIKLRVVDKLGNAVDEPIVVDGSSVGRSWAPISLLIGKYNVEVNSQFGQWRDSVEVREAVLLDLPVHLSGAMTSFEDLNVTPKASTAAGRDRSGLERFMLFAAIGAGGAALYADAQLIDRWDAYKEEVGGPDAHGSYLEYEKWFKLRQYTIAASMTCGAVWLVSMISPVGQISGDDVGSGLELQLGLTPLSSLPGGFRLGIVGHF